ncbi:hypothetical protein HU200_034284 [Digitaria exilis]|uniref:Endonuclease/exonuclease/phosphatase domain-containing protein n=1 Tax=Digitaria exilis TaxID=1010633 RepID=A0A835BVK2_9POAL|nr:hypothetical protein HU200_034284 [Digitaria exilis]
MTGLPRRAEAHKSGSGQRSTTGNGRQAGARSHVTRKKCARREVWVRDAACLRPDGPGTLRFSCGHGMVRKAAGSEVGHTTLAEHTPSECRTAHHQPRRSVLGRKHGVATINVVLPRHRSERGHCAGRFCLFGSDAGPGKPAGSVEPRGYYWHWPSAISALVASCLDVSLHNVRMAWPPPSCNQLSLFTKRTLHDRLLLPVVISSDPLRAGMATQGSIAMRHAPMTSGGAGAGTGELHLAADQGFPNRWEPVRFDRFPTKPIRDASRRAGVLCWALAGTTQHASELHRAMEFGTRTRVLSSWGMTNIKFLTYNVWSCEHIIERHDPDVIFLQVMIRRPRNLNISLHPSSKRLRGGETTTDPRPPARGDVQPRGRDSFGHRLRAPARQSVRAFLDHFDVVHQPNERSASFVLDENVVLGGDFGWDDDLDGPLRLGDGWVDAWRELRGSGGDDEEDDGGGWTYDAVANPMVRCLDYLPVERRRPDRFICKLRDFTLRSIEMVGEERIPGVTRFGDGGKPSLRVAAHHLP